MTEDAVDRITAQWRRERPDLDSSPMEVFGRLGRLAADLDVLLRPVFARRGLGEGEFDVLATLRRAGEPYTLTPGQLAASMMVTSGAVSKRIDRLEARRLVVRRAGAQDARSKLVVLTEAGVRLVDDVLVAHLENEHRLLAHLPPEDRRELADLLRRLGAGLPSR
ncbi:MarR family winged helix-turn-helix transcriptional regulator [Stackebrandtia soli]|uniref:MarR family winged helix-turn-helix transcriptional regulator n=1 Tax=Stackebrandtia soli TaxID=1892856 RepID=UPI0039E91A0C